MKKWCNCDEKKKRKTNVVSGFDKIRYTCTYWKKDRKTRLYSSRMVKRCWLFVLKGKIGVIYMYTCNFGVYPCVTNIYTAQYTCTLSTCTNMLTTCTPYARVTWSFVHVKTMRSGARAGNTFSEIAIIKQHEIYRHINMNIRCTCKNMKFGTRAHVINERTCKVWGYAYVHGRL